VVIDANLSPIVGPDGQARGHVLACRDVTETEALHARLSDALRSREASLTALRNVLEGHRSKKMPVKAETAADDLQAISQLISELVAQLQERGEQLAAIFELCPDGFVSFDADRCVNYVSPAVTRLTLIQESQLMGLGEVAFNGMLRALRVPRGRELRSFEAMRQRSGAAGQRELIELGQPMRRVLELGLREGGSKSVSQVLYLRDVTQETEIDRMKSEFLSTAAHELRTPMASIFGFVELMMNGKVPPQRRQQTMEIIHRQTGQMIDIVNELLDLARIEANGGKEFAPEALDLGELLARVVHDFQPPGDRAPPVVGALKSGSLVLADRGKAIQAILNVLSNAYKYSPQGGDVRVGLISRPAAPGEDQPLAGIEIQDRGIGMTAEQLARIGERFYRADASGSIPGTGLGMSIVKEVLELQGGAMELASEHGEGTRVSLWWPALAPGGKEPGTPTLGPRQAWGAAGRPDAMAVGSSLQSGH
jgi:signal transduction histidine kinase